MGLSRRLPASINSRKAALDTAFDKMSNPGPSGNFLSDATNNRLEVARAAYQDGFNALIGARFQLHSATPTKRTAYEEARTYVRHFIMVFNMGVTRGVYTAAQRSFFNIEVTDDTAPTINSEADLLAKGQQIINGNAARLSAGGAAMGFPTIAEVTDKFNTFKNLHISYSNLKDELDIEQESMEAQKTEVDNVILRVWNEVETFYSEEEIDSKRANAREWGVKYIPTGTSKAVMLELRMRDGGELPEVGQVLLEDEQGTVNEDGNAIYNTILFGDLTVQVTGDEIQSHSSIITVAENGDQTFVILLDRV